MKPSIQVNPQLAITHWSDELGSIDFPAGASSTRTPAFRLLRYDDAWRPLAGEVQKLQGNGTASLDATWEEAYAGPRAYGRPADAAFPLYWPASFDAWPYAGDVHAYAPMLFSGQVTSRPVTTPHASGIEFTLTITAWRAPGGVYPRPGRWRRPDGVRIGRSTDAACLVLPGS